MRLISGWRNVRDRLLVAAAVAVLLLPAFTTGVHAADSGMGASGPKWYLGLNVPIMFIDDSDSVERGTAVDPRRPQQGAPYTADALTEYETGFRVSGVVGREFGNGLRVDGELFFARAEIDKLIYKGRTTTVSGRTLDIPGDHAIPVSGPASQLGAMVNVWYDFNAGSRWRPYLGGGIGLVRVDWGDVKYDRNEVAQGAATELALLQACAQQMLPPSCDLPPQVRQGVIAGSKLSPGTVPALSDTDTVFAFQLGAGVGYQYSEALTFQVGYRMLKADDLEFSGKSDMGSTAMATTEMLVHLFEIGMRYRF